MDTKNLALVVKFVVEGHSLEPSLYPDLVTSNAGYVDYSRVPICVCGCQNRRNG